MGLCASVPDSDPSRAPGPGPAAPRDSVDTLSGSAGAGTNKPLLHADVSDQHAIPETAVFAVMNSLAPPPQQESKQQQLARRQALMHEFTEDWKQFEADSGVRLHVEALALAPSQWSTLENFSMKRDVYNLQCFTRKHMLQHVVDFVNLTASSLEFILEQYAKAHPSSWEQLPELCEDKLQDLVSSAHDTHVQAETFAEWCAHQAVSHHGSMLHAGFTNNGSDSKTQSVATVSVFAAGLAASNEAFDAVTEDTSPNSSFNVQMWQSVVKNTGSAVCSFIRSHMPKAVQTAATAVTEVLRVCSLSLAQALPFANGAVVLVREICSKRARYLALCDCLEQLYHLLLGADSGLGTELLRMFANEDVEELSGWHIIGAYSQVFQSLDAALQFLVVHHPTRGEDINSFEKKLTTWIMQESLQNDLNRYVQRFKDSVLKLLMRKATWTTQQLRGLHKSKEASFVGIAYRVLSWIAPTAHNVLLRTEYNKIVDGVSDMDNAHAGVDVEFGAHHLPITYSMPNPYGESHRNVLLCADMLPSLSHAVGGESKSSESVALDYHLMDRLLHEPTASQSLPAVLALCGLSGSGRSHFIMQLCKRWCWRMMDTLSKVTARNTKQLAQIIQGLCIPLVVPAHQLFRAEQPDALLPLFFQTYLVDSKQLCTDADLSALLQCAPSFPFLIIIEDLDLLDPGLVAPLLCRSRLLDHWPRSRILFTCSPSCVALLHNIASKPGTSHIARIDKAECRRVLQVPAFLVQQPQRGQVQQVIDAYAEHHSLSKATRERIASLASSNPAFCTTVRSVNMLCTAQSSSLSFDHNRLCSHRGAPDSINHSAPSHTNTEVQSNQLFATKVWSHFVYMSIFNRVERVRDCQHGEIAEALLYHFQSSVEWIMRASEFIAFELLFKVEGSVMSETNVAAKLKEFCHHNIDVCFEPTLLRMLMPLRRVFVNDPAHRSQIMCQFDHPFLSDFFMAQAIAHDLLNAPFGLDDTARGINEAAWHHILHNLYLSQRLLTHTPRVLSLIASFIDPIGFGPTSLLQIGEVQLDRRRESLSIQQNRPCLHDTKLQLLPRELFATIEACRGMACSSAHAAAACANAVSVLAAARVNMSNLDFSGIPLGNTMSSPTRSSVRSPGSHDVSLRCTGIVQSSHTCVCTLPFADLGGAVLTNSVFTGTNLCGANLSGALLGGCDFCASELSNTQLGALLTYDRITHVAHAPDLSRICAVSEQSPDNDAQHSGVVCTLKSVSADKVDTVGLETVTSVALLGDHNRVEALWCDTVQALVFSSSGPVLLVALQPQELSSSQNPVHLTTIGAQLATFDIICIHSSRCDSYVAVLCTQLSQDCRVYIFCRQVSRITENSEWNCIRVPSAVNSVDGLPYAASDFAFIDQTHIAVALVDGNVIVVNITGMETSLHPLQLPSHADWADHPGKPCCITSWSSTPTGLTSVNENPCAVSTVAIAIGSEIRVWKQGPQPSVGDTTTQVSTDWKVCSGLDTRTHIIGMVPLSGTDAHDRPVGVESKNDISDIVVVATRSNSFVIWSLALKETLATYTISPELSINSFAVCATAVSKHTDFLRDIIVAAACRTDVRSHASYSSEARLVLCPISLSSTTGLENASAAMAAPSRNITCAVLCDPPHRGAVAVEEAQNDFSDIEDDDDDDGVQMQSLLVCGDDQGNVIVIDLYSAAVLVDTMVLLGRCKQVVTSETEDVKHGAEFANGNRSITAICANNDATQLAVIVSDHLCLLELRCRRSHTAVAAVPLPMWSVIFTHAWDLTLWLAALNVANRSGTVDPVDASETMLPHVEPPHAVSISFNQRNTTYASMALCVMFQVQHADNRSQDYMVMQLCTDGQSRYNCLLDATDRSYRQMCDILVSNSYHLATLKNNSRVLIPCTARMQLHSPSFIRSPSHRVTARLYDGNVTVCYNPTMHTTSGSTQSDIKSNELEDVFRHNAPSTLLNRRCTVVQRERAKTMLHRVVDVHRRNIMWRLRNTSEMECYEAQLDDMTRCSPIVRATLLQHGAIQNSSSRCLSSNCNTFV
jgi:Pentapeptide repeats (8 copies)